MIIVSLFNLAKRVIERRRRLVELRRREQRHVAAIDFHAFQDDFDGRQQGPHYWRGRAEGAWMRRVCDEQRMLETGKGFWELYDIEDWARRMRTMERDRAIELVYMWERLPDSAIMPVHQRMIELRREEERIERDAYLTRQPRPTPEQALAEFHSLLQDINPLDRDHQRMFPPLSRARYPGYGE